MSTDEKEWKKSLTKFLYSFFKKHNVEEDKDYRKKLVSKEALKIWTSVFTHASYNPNNGENYEQYEKIGDAVMKLQLISILTEEIGIETLTPAITTYYVNDVLSKYNQGEMAKELGLTKYLRTNIPQTISSSEDLLEAFFGGLLEVGNKILGFGTGYILTWNLAVNLYSGTEVENAEDLLHPKIAVKNIMDKLSLPNVEENSTINEENDKMTFKVVLELPKASIDFFRKENIKIPSILATGYGTKKSEASFNAYKNALKTLNDYGITTEYADDYKNNLLYSKNKNLRIYESEVLQKLKTMGYSGFERQKFKTAKSIVAQIIGLKDNKKYVVYTTEFPLNMNIIETIENLFKQFLEQ